MKEHHVAVIGAGPAGVSAAVSLRDRGIRPLLIDKAGAIGSAWRGRYDRLKLNTGRPFSHLPNRPYPKGTPMFPSRDDVVAHLDRHAREDGIDLRLGTVVDRIDRTDGGWRLITSTGGIEARYVVVATGYLHTPSIPDWPGSFDGELLHSSDYRNPEPFAGKRVLVVGSGTSGMEIAYDLTTGDVAKVSMSVRTPPNIMLRRGPGGMPADLLAVPLFHLPPRISDRIAAAVQRRTFGDLTELGLPIPAEGPFARAHRLHVAPSLVDMEVVDAVRDGSIEVVAGVTGFEGQDVLLTNGGRVTADSVVCATGYGRGLEPLVGHLDVLAPDGTPIALAPTPAAAGLYFHGLLARPSLIGYIGKQSRGLARSIASRPTYSDSSASLG